MSDYVNDEMNDDSANNGKRLKNCGDVILKTKTREFVIFYCKIDAACAIMTEKDANNRRMFYRLNWYTDGEGAGMNGGKGLRRDNTVKNGISARLLFALTAVLFSVGLFCACSNADGITPEEDGELVQYFRDKLTETLPSPDGENVYWVRSGSVYHLTPDCKFIAGDEDIICSSIAESGKTRLCSACDKAALSAAGESGDGVLPDGMEDAGADGTEKEETEISSDCVDGVERQTGETVQGDTSDPDAAGSADGGAVADAENGASNGAGGAGGGNENSIANGGASGGDAETPTPSDAGGAVTPNGATVYWTDNGKVWHTTPNCPSLARSGNIKSGTAEESGKERVCMRCG